MATSEATSRKGGPERAGALHLGPVILFDLGPVDLGPTDVLHLDPVVLLDPRPPRTAMASAAGVAYADATMADAYDALAARLSDRYAREVSWLRNGQLFVGIAGGGPFGQVGAVGGGGRPDQRTRGPSMPTPVSPLSRPHARTDAPACRCTAGRRATRSSTGSWGTGRLRAARLGFAPEG